MKKLIRILTLLAGLLCMPSALFAQSITENEFLDQLRRTHPLFEKEQLSSQVEMEEQNSLKGGEDWIIFSTATYSHEEPAIVFTPPRRLDSLSYSSGFERLFWNTGGKFSVAFLSSYADLDSAPFFGFPESVFENRLSIAYEQPLLKNWKGFLDSLGYNLKQYDIDVSEIGSLENQEDFLAESADKFLDWVFLTEQTKIVTERLKLSEEELATARKKRDAFLVDPVDVIRAEDAVRIAKQNLFLVGSKWKALQAELAVLTQNDELYGDTPEYDLYRIIELPPLEKAVSQLKERSRLIRSINVQLAQLEYTRRGFAQESKPELSLVTEANVKGADDDFTDAFEMDKPDTLIGLNFRYPIGNRTARSQIKKTDLQILQLKKELDDLTINLVSTLTNLYIQIKELEKVLLLNVEQIQSARERTKEELKLYNQGRVELTFVIQSRDNEENAKLTYATNALSYHKLVVEYRSLMDELLKRDSVTSIEKRSEQ